MHKSVDFNKGDRVRARFRGRSKWYPGIVHKDRRDGTYDVAYDDGEKEYMVEKSYIELVERGRDDTGNSKRTPKFQEGDKIEADFKGRGKWHPAKITKEHDDGTYNVKYDDGDIELRVEKDMIRSVGYADERPISPKKAMRFEEGDKVEGNFKGRGKWHPAKISRDREDGTYDLRYDDGDIELRVEKDMIRLF